MQKILLEPIFLSMVGGQQVKSSLDRSVDGLSSWFSPAFGVSKKYASIADTVVMTFRK